MYLQIQDKDVDGNSGNFYRARAQITENELKILLQALT